MEGKILIVSNKKSNLLNSIIYLLTGEKLEYIISNNVENISEEVSHVIYVDLKDDDVYNQLKSLDVPVLVISDKKNVLKPTKSNINYVITNLYNDDTSYTRVQLEYLFKKGLYSILNSSILNFITVEDNTNGYVIDISECEALPKEWKFKFDSIAETYSWLKKQRKLGNNDCVYKVINFYEPEKIYNDSSKEINYLFDSLLSVKNGVKIIDIFICTKEELKKFKCNYFFKALLNNISDTYKIYFIDKEKLSINEPRLLEEFLDGVIVYEDCIYRDTYDDEYSLGYVDCNRDTIEKYNKNFDYVLEKYGQKLNSDGDIDGI